MGAVLGRSIYTGERGPCRRMVTGRPSLDNARAERVRPHLAAGYALSSGGLKAVTGYDVVTVGGGAAYSPTSDMARYVCALLSGGAGERGSVLKPETLTQMFEPHYQPDPRIPGIGLGVFRDEVGGHRTIGHDGTVVIVASVSLADVPATRRLW